MQTRSRARLPGLRRHASRAEVLAELPHSTPVELPEGGDPHESDKAWRREVMQYLLKLREYLQAGGWMSAAREQLKWIWPSGRRTGPSSGTIYSHRAQRLSVP